MDFVVFNRAKNKIPIARNYNDAPIGFVNFAALIRIVRKSYAAADGLRSLT